MYSTDSVTVYPRISDDIRALHDSCDVEDAFDEDHAFTRRLEGMIADRNDTHPLLRTSLASHVAQAPRWRLELIRRRAAARVIAGELLLREEGLEEGCDY